MFSDTDTSLPYGDPNEYKRAITSNWNYGRMGNLVDNDWRIFWKIQEGTKVRIINIFTNN